ncbi:hypothetical protein FHX42_001838 [Saccharopolyspora lacisalsi]|uniref:DUF2188 domain-containing protein n=1 Tax=Halosaccharopolyspora lacisalsi TaxID=1000566 RepID=A0A839DZ45_9PSEU|nr:DUF2188 domain-containing protein [Halosaccharopolyspora lacisalsi]MBA8824491.1 hypothetical protein [Halosaccharopolyspora lacisalsi]
MNDRIVQPAGSEGWSISEPGKATANRYCADYDDAFRQAREAILREGGGQLRVHSEDEEEVQTYAIEPHQQSGG